MYCIGLNCYLCLRMSIIPVILYIVAIYNSCCVCMCISTVVVHSPRSTLRGHYCRSRATEVLVTPL